MKAKKRDRPITEEPKRQPDLNQSEHEQFLQAFEKPTQIYRFLRTRHALSPLFLNRTASYMVGRNKRKANTRSSFKVDSILAKVEAEHKKKVYGYRQEYLNITFCAFLNPNDKNCRHIEVETILVKICNSKRKEMPPSSLEISIGKVSVPCNPTTLEAVHAATVSIPSESFTVNGQNQIKSFCLRLRATSLPSASSNPAPKSARPTLRGKDTMNGDLENVDPPLRKKLRRSSDERSGGRLAYDGMLRDKNSNKNGLIESTVYSAELVIYDNHRQCLLTAGEYEVLMEEIGATAIPSQLGRHASWERVADGRETVSVDVFGSKPTIKFSLSWNPGPLQNSIAGLQSTDICSEVTHNGRNGGRAFNCKDASHKEATATSVVAKRPKRIFYQFLYNSSARQQTEARKDFVCPWCFLSCPQLYALLSHLRCCHARFNFTYVEHPKGARIDVSINDFYDGSYVGNPQELQPYVGYAFNRNGPVRRVPVTHILVTRSKSPSFDLSEFQEPEPDAPTSRHLIHGHSRLYYHSLTCQPILPSEIDADSEGENDPEWLRQKTRHMIDEFTDVNEGEKEVMKLWNLHVMHYNYISDCRLPAACETFVRDCGPEIVRRNLSRNFLLHLVNLSDFGLIRPEVIYRTAIQYFRLRRQLEDSAVAAAAGDCGRPDGDAAAVKPDDDGKPDAEDKPAELTDSLLTASPPKASCPS